MKTQTNQSETQAITSPANPWRTDYIIHPRTRKPCAVMVRKTEEVNRFGETMLSVILPYTPRERLFGRRKQIRAGKRFLAWDQQSHEILMSESKLNNLRLSKAERMAFLKETIA